MNKKIVFGLCLLMTFVLIGSALAITASIGNARMVLRADVGDVLDKYILVRNINNVSVDIVLTASGDLADDITIKDSNFTLEPGDEKNAYFTLKVTKPGMTESKINVQFTPTGQKNGGGLSSTIIVIANDTGSDNSDNTDNTDTTDNTDASTDTSDSSSSTATSTSVTGMISVGKDNKYLVPLIVTGVVALIFIVLLIIYYSRFKKKDEKEIEEQIREREKELKEIVAKENILKQRVVKTKPKKRVNRRG